MLLVLLVLLALVWGVARLVGGGDEGGTTRGAASQVAAEREAPESPEATPTPDGDDREARRERREERRKERREEKKDALAKPSGPCLDSDVVVTPDVVEPYVGRPEVVLQLTTVESEACTWDVTPHSVFLVISDEKGPLWSSQDCPSAIPTEEVVVRRELAAEVEIAWNGKQSDRDCSEATDWVWPGQYVATAVARGAVTPVEVEFEMTRKVVEEKPDPEDDLESESEGESEGPRTQDQRGRDR